MNPELQFYLNRLDSPPNILCYLQFKQVRIVSLCTLLSFVIVLTTLYSLLWSFKFSCRLEMVELMCHEAFWWVLWRQLRNHWVTSLSWGWLEHLVETLVSCKPSINISTRICIFSIRSHWRCHPRKQFNWGTFWEVLDNNYVKWCFYFI